MMVIGNSRRELDTKEMSHVFGFTACTTSFDEAVHDADFVSLHIPASPPNRHFIDASRFRLMPASAWLINTARGTLVDEEDLWEALVGGRLAGAALDVYENEPYRPVSPDKDLRKLPNLILTAHAASSTVEACGRMAERALWNIALAEEQRYGEMDLLNRSVLKTLSGRISDEE